MIESRYLGKKKTQQKTHVCNLRYRLLCLDTVYLLSDHPGVFSAGFLASDLWAASSPWGSTGLAPRVAVGWTWQLALGGGWWMSRELGTSACGFLGPFSYKGPDLHSGGRVLCLASDITAMQTAASMLHVRGRSAGQMLGRWYRVLGGAGGGKSGLQKRLKHSHSSFSHALLPLPCVFQDMEAWISWGVFLWMAAPSQMLFAKGSWSSPTKGSDRVTSPGSSVSATAASAKYLAGKGGTTSLLCPSKVLVPVSELKAAGKWRTVETSGNQPSESRGFLTTGGFYVPDVKGKWYSSYVWFAPSTVSYR